MRRSLKPQEVVVLAVLLLFKRESRTVWAFKQLEKLSTRWQRTTRRATARRASLTS